MEKKDSAATGSFSEKQDDTSIPLCEVCVHYKGSKGCEEMSFAYARFYMCRGFRDCPKVYLNTEHPKFQKFAELYPEDTTGLLERQKAFEEGRPKYDITYEDTKEFFYERIAAPKPGRHFDAGSAAATWLYEFETHQDELWEAERLNVMLPLLKWCVENNTMIEELEDELYLYYEDYTEGRLDGILDPDEEEEILNDLIWSYKTYFKRKGSCQE